MTLFNLSLCPGNSKPGYDYVGWMFICWYDTLGNVTTPSVCECKQYLHHTRGCPCVGVTISLHPTRVSLTPRNCLHVTDVWVSAGGNSHCWALTCFKLQSARPEISQLWRLIDMCLHHPKRCNFLSCQIQGLMEQLAGTEICVGLLSVATLWRSNEITCWMWYPNGVGVKKQPQ